jgi:putative membrane protein
MARGRVTCSNQEDEMRDHKTSERHDGEVLKGLAVGLFAGLVASWMMNQFQTLWSKLAEQQEGGGNGSGQKKKESQESDEGEDATVKAAEAISEGVFDHRLTKSEKKVAGPAVHYAMGATSGAVYGALAELTPLVTIGAGLPFGTAVWLIADETTVPALGLSESPTEVPLSKHAYALASHFVYGLTTEIVRRVVREVL